MSGAREKRLWRGTDVKAVVTDVADVLPFFLLLTVEIFFSLSLFMRVSFFFLLSCDCHCKVRHSCFHDEWSAVPPYEAQDKRLVWQVMLLNTSAGQCKAVSRDCLKGKWLHQRLMPLLHPRASILSHTRVYQSWLELERESEKERKELTVISLDTNACRTFTGS